LIINGLDPQVNILEQQFIALTKTTLGADLSPKEMVTLQLSIGILYVVLSSQLKR